MKGRWQKEMPGKAGHYWTRTDGGEASGIVEVCALKSGALFTPAYLRRGAGGREVVEPGTSWGGWWWSEPVMPIPEFENVKRAQALGASSVEKLGAQDRKRVSAGLPPVDVTKVRKNAVVEKPVEYAVYRQEWVESERGWGVRPDGASLHLTLDDCKSFVDGYNKEFNNRSSAPDCYTRAEGDPRPVKVAKEIYEKLMQHDGSTTGWRRHGIWE